MTTHALPFPTANYAIAPSPSLSFPTDRFTRAFHHIDLLRCAFTGLAVAVVLNLSACSSTSKTKATSEAEPQAITTLEEHLVRAKHAEESGEKDKARELYRSAAKVYPVAEEPWQKLAESYFNSGDYGNAILASQEVMQRDPQDPVAASVQAISGLRLSTQALNTLREQAEAQRVKAGGAPGKPLTNASIIVAARLEAEALTRQLREVLGEPVLVPQAVPSQGHRPRARTVPPRPNTVQPAGMATQAAPLAQAPVAATASTIKPVAPPRSAAPAGNPFDKLK